MAKSASVSLLVSTYNWPEALNLCLLSIKGQTVMPGEIVIADDGSTDETRQLIESFRDKFDIPIYHVWQPDRGFRLSKIRNKAIAKSSMDYIIQIDGDLILHPEFISDHLKFRTENAFSTGGRLMMDEELSQRALKEGFCKINVFSRGISNHMNGIRSKLLRTYFGLNFRTNDIYYMRGCNMAFWRSDLVKVNGYNEEFVGWGREDNEIAIRLINSGVRKRSIKFGAIAFHLYHKESTRQALSDNEELLSLSINGKSEYCGMGINQYLGLQYVS